MFNDRKYQYTRGCYDTSSEHVGKVGKRSEKLWEYAGKKCPLAECILLEV